ncbi:MAG: hypothetical protein E7176_06010 [Erysipelotrichaceae bacterium]|nr:hypothetical protein [Erysipelotrichaceae bacterium]
MAVKKTNKAVKPSGLTAPNKLKILVTICDRSKAIFYRDILEGYDVNLQIILYGRGTAPSDIVSYLGLADDGKAIILSVVSEKRIKEILSQYEDKYFKTKNGKGLAFTVPISSVIGVTLYQFLTNKGAEA